MCLEVCSRTLNHRCCQRTDALRRCEVSDRCQSGQKKKNRASHRTRGNSLGSTLDLTYVRLKSFSGTIENLRKIRIGEPISLQRSNADIDTGVGQIDWIHSLEDRLGPSDHSIYDKSVSLAAPH